MLGTACRTARYRLVVNGELGARYASAFNDMTISAHHGITEISGGIIDSAHLQGCERIAGLGLTLHRLTPLDTETASRPPTPRNQSTPTDHEGTLRGPASPNLVASRSLTTLTRWQMHIRPAGMATSRPTSTEGP